MQPLQANKTTNMKKLSTLEQESKIKGSAINEAMAFKSNLNILLGQHVTKANKEEIAKVLSTVKLFESEDLMISLAQNFINAVKDGRSDAKQLQSELTRNLGEVLPDDVFANVNKLVKHYADISPDESVANEIIEMLRNYQLEAGNFESKVEEAESEVKGKNITVKYGHDKDEIVIVSRHKQSTVYNLEEATEIHKLLGTLLNL
jgi:hypothetical protein